ncbi:MAG: hypothetical protein L0228_01005 [Planctomycetes bacterium]|nr:hypothetical protein [Planctomycetota bacterium]
MRTDKLFASLVCALTVFLCGCTGPWAGPPFKRERALRAAAIPNDTDMPPAQVAQVKAAESEPDMTAVLDKLQQVRAIDPPAEPKLLEELRRTPAKSWPLVAEQFRASLAYHEKLAAKNQPARREGEATTRQDLPQSTEPLALETGYDSGNAATTARTLTSLNSRPSAPIGSLVDPRSASVDGVSSEALAKATPYSTPGAIPQTAQQESAAPREFVANDTAYPIPAKNAKNLSQNRRGLAHFAESSEQNVPVPLPENGSETSSKPAVIQTRLEAVGSRLGEPNETQPPDSESDWQQLVEQAAEDLSGRVAASPATTAEVHQHVSLRMLWLLAGDTEKALEPIPHISPAEQDYWSRQLFALATYLDHHSQSDDKRRAAASVTHLDDAVASLRELGSLSLRNLAFCKNVYGYGSFEPFEHEQFSPGQQVSLYVDVENYRSQPTEKGFCTSLSSTYEILDEKGERVSGGEFPDVDDCCRSRRRDFHIQYGLALPEKMTPGRYQLQLIVKDRQSDKIGHATAAFEIRGNRSLTTPLSLPK